MSDVLEDLHNRRCGRKQGYRTPEQAERRAREASEKTGELIIVYKCFDCGMWHIGHADHCQELATPKGDRPCVVCGKPIPEGKLKRGRKHQFKTRTCSKKCHEASRKPTMFNPNADAGRSGEESSIKGRR